MGGGKLSGKPDEMLGGNLAMYFYPINGVVVKVQIALCYGNRYIYIYKFRLDGFLNSRTGLPF